MPQALVETHPCPACGTYVNAATNPISKRQDRFLDELCNPKHTSVEKAAIAAGYAPSTAKTWAYELGKKLRQGGALAKRQRAKLDKASGQRRLATKLLESADNDAMLERLSVQERIQLGGSLLKLAIETEAHLGPQDDGDKLTLLRSRVLRRRLLMLRSIVRAVAAGALDSTRATGLAERIDRALARAE